SIMPGSRYCPAASISLRALSPLMLVAIFSMRPWRTSRSASNSRPSLIRRALRISRSVMGMFPIAVRGRWHRVITARMPGVAAAQAPHGQPAATQRAVAFNGFDGVVRAAGMEAAAWPEQGADQVLVEPHQAQQQAF